VSAWFAAGVATAYVGGMVGLHRLNVWRRRRASGGFPVLLWWDWDLLLQGLITPPAADANPKSLLHAPPLLLPDRAPPPRCLLTVTQDQAARRDALIILVRWPQASGLMPAVSAAGFSNEEQAWISLLVQARNQPLLALGALSKPRTPAEIYLHELLDLVHQTTPTNLELTVFASKRRLRDALVRHPEASALYYVRALASSLLGANQVTVDDMGRAVYFSRMAPFYREAVLRTPYIEDVRPALVRECRA
jgi:hypothetical protein